MAFTAAFQQSGSSSAGIQVISASDIGQASSTREIPLLFLFRIGFLMFLPDHIHQAVGSLKSCIGLVEVGRLGQWLNIPTQGWRGECPV